MEDYLGPKLGYSFDNWPEPGTQEYWPIRWLMEYCILLKEKYYRRQKVLKQKMKIALVTACGGSKVNYPTKAYQLYKSPRIKAVYHRKDGCDMFILSAKHNLISTEKVIAPYDETMTYEKAKRFIPIISKKLKGNSYDWIIFYRAGSRKEYNHCIQLACKEAKVNFISFGYGFMAEINEIDKVLASIREGTTKQINLKNLIMDVNKDD